MKSTRFIFITMGPTGSGKSSLANEIIKKYDVNNVKQFLIDDLIENSDYFKEEVAKITNSNYKNTQIKKGNAFLNNVNSDIKDDLSKQISEKYFEARKLGCKNKSPKGCSQLFDNMLQEAIKNGENILFETTGTYVPMWLVDMAKTFTPKWIQNQLVFGVSLIEKGMLKSRINKRTKEQMKRWMNEEREKFPAPRFPLPDEKLIQKINDTVNDLIRSCNVIKCKIPYDIYIYDNSGNNLKFIYKNSFKSVCQRQSSSSFPTKVGISASQKPKGRHSKLSSRRTVANSST